MHRPAASRAAERGAGTEIRTIVLGAPGVRRWFPQRRRHVRRHPDVAALLGDGWRYGGAPIYQFDRRWPGFD